MWKYVSHVPAPVKKPQGFKRKSEVADKEVLNLTGGLFPIKLVDNVKQVNIEKRSINITLRRWRSGFVCR